MRSLRNAVLAACAVAVPVGLAAAAHAQQAAPRGIMLYTADGTPFGILTPVQSDTREASFAPVAAAPGVLSVAEIMQRQDALMDQMFAQMRAMFDAPFGLPGMPGFPGGGQGYTSVTLGGGPGMAHGFCGQTVTYTFNGRSAQPTVQVQKVGDACGTLGVPGLQAVPASEAGAPVMRPAPIQPRQSQPRIYNVMYRQPAGAVLASR